MTTGIKMTDIYQTIVMHTRKIIEDKGEECPELTASTEFLTNTCMDSLDLATLLVNLEIELDQDPFREGFKQFQTIQELADLYDQGE